MANNRSGKVILEIQAACLVKNNLVAKSIHNGYNIML